MRTSRYNSGPALAVAVAIAIGLTSACTERVPTGLDDGQTPDPPVTVTIQLPWAQFGSNLEVFGGFGRTSEMPGATVARTYGGVNANTLIGFNSFPRSVQVRDRVNNTLVTDTALTFIDAYVLIKFDTLASTNTDTVTLQLDETLESWEPESASWTHSWNVPALVRPWSQPGGGAVLPIRTRTWDPALGDSMQLFLDSTQIARWRTGPDSVRSARLSLLSDGQRLDLSQIQLRLVALSAKDADTTLVLTVDPSTVTYIYDPQAGPPVDGFRVGGAPAWRSVLDLALPSVLNGPPELCAAAGCPFQLAPTNVTFAGLGLRTRRPPDAFLPSDSITVDVRAVLSRPALPRSPLGFSVVGSAGKSIEPALFGAGEGSLVEIPITTFVQNYLRGPDETGRAPSNTIAVLATPEPETFTFAEFFGPGGSNEPVLKLILTVSPPMELP